MTTDPLQCLADTLHACEEGAPLPPQARAWLRSGLALYLHRGEALESALRLTVASRLIARNRALIDAAAVLDPDGQFGAWELASRLRDAIFYYEQRVAPRLRAGADRELSKQEECIAAAFLAKAPRMLRSQRALYDLLKNSDLPLQ